MARLAIKGHPTRGSEVIALLEMMGGKNNDCSGKNIYAVYAIPNNGYIYPYQHAHNKYPDDFKIFTLEEFLEKFPYKVGDKVSSKYLKNYKIEKMEWEDTNNRVIYKLQGMGWYSVNELQLYKEETMETAKITITPQYHYNEDKIELCVAKDYEIKEENGKYYAVKKQSKYPKTYEECCDILQLEHTFELKDLTMDEEKLIDSFIRLKRCRDAYWKIAGKQMGLRKPFEPDFGNDLLKYYISFHNNKIDKGVINYSNKILAFPTAEMRDAFYENFKELINETKELL